MFAIYLEAAIRELKNSGLLRPSQDVCVGIPKNLIYADDTDFVSLAQ